VDLDSTPQDAHLKKKGMHWAGILREGKAEEGQEEIGKEQFWR
jgi:hypothetical protein